jgi:hypothetical protein
METLPGNDKILIYRDTLTGRVGLSSKDGTPLTETLYDEINIIDAFTPHILQVTRGDLYGLLHESGNELLAPGEYYVGPAGVRGYFTISTFRGQFGVFYSGRMIIPTRYEEDIAFNLRSDSTGKQWVDHIRSFQSVRRRQSVVLFDSVGKVLNTPSIEGQVLYEMETSGSLGYYELRDRKLRGVYHVHRGIVVPARYEYFEEVTTADGEPMYFIVQRKGRYGLYDGYGEQVLPAVYSFIEPIFGTNSLFQAADAEGRVIEVLPDYSIREVPDEN